MADYIKRSDVIKICEMYSQHCFETNDSRGQDIADRILEDVVEIPTADVEEVKWIDVNERLPKNNLTRVLVFLKDNEFTKPIGLNKIDTDRCIDGKWVRWGEHVTHWMYLPDEPIGF